MEPTSYFDPRRSITKHERHLPHWQQGDVPCFVTWRLADALPQAKLRLWRYEREAWIVAHPKPWDEPTEDTFHRRFSDKIDQWLDQGMGSCALRNPQASRSTAETLLHFNQQRYRMIALVVMPNHVHTLFQPIDPFSMVEILKSWKSFSARQANRILGRQGTLWQDEYWDRLIRSEAHFYRVIRYIQENPARANLREGEYVLWLEGMPGLTEDGPPGPS